MTDSKYPEHAKMHLVKDHSQAIGEFLESLQGMGLYLCEINRSDQLVLSNRTANDILAQFFGIDLQKLEAEKRQMLDNIRRGNQQERDANE